MSLTSGANSRRLKNAKASDRALPNGDLAEVIKQQRAAIADKKKEIERHRRAPVTREKARGDGAIYTPQIIVNGLAHVVFPVDQLRVANEGLGLIAWQFRDTLLQRIDAEVGRDDRPNEGVAPELIDLER